MKGLDLFSKRFLVICFGLSAVLLSAGLFVGSINSATASENPTLFPSASNAGNIMMDMEVMSHEGNRYQYVLVWNNDSGESTRYYLDWNTKEFSVAKAQLPENPLGY